MSTLEKTIDLLNTLPESQIETIYNFVQFLSLQQNTVKSIDTESLDDIFDNIVGVLSNTGKTLEEYKNERLNNTQQNK